jgi:hypothetical protein
MPQEQDNLERWAGDSGETITVPKPVPKRRIRGKMIK